MNLVIRHATTEDAKLIADISHSTFYDSFAADNTEANMKKFLGEQFTKGKLILEVGAPENTFFLAYMNGQVAGYAKIRDGRKPAILKEYNAIEIARLYATSQWIGTGVGKALMQASIDLAIKKNKKYVWLGVWEKNQRAIDFYHKWGFEKIGETGFLLGDDMQKDWLMGREVE